MYIKRGIASVDGKELSPLFQGLFPTIQGLGMNLKLLGHFDAIARNLPFFEYLELLLWGKSSPFLWFDRDYSERHK